MIIVDNRYEGGAGMFVRNTKDVNKIVSYSLFVCAFAIALLIICTYVGIFEFSGYIVFSLLTFGFISTLSPIILFKLKVNDTFLKYYILIMISILIGLLGTSNSIGIYITYILVPVVSCLYFDVKLTKFTVIFSYLVMTVGVYFNTLNKLEVSQLGWTHYMAFRNYQIGFTVEYFVVTIFLIQIVKRAQKFMEDQYNTLLDLKAEQLRFELLTKSSKDIIIQYFVNEDRYKANRSIFSNGDENHEILIEKFMMYLDQRPLLKEKVIPIIEMTLNSENGIYIEYDFSYQKGDTNIPLWYQIEGFICKDEMGRPISIIGKFHNSTQAKLIQQQMLNHKVSDLYLQSVHKGRDSLHSLAFDETLNISDEDSAKFSEGHRFIAGILELLKYTKDLEDSLYEVIPKVGIYFQIDRICIVERKPNENCSHMTYQWNLHESDMVQELYEDISNEDSQKLYELFDEYGYLEINTKDNTICNTECERNTVCTSVISFMKEKLNGNAILGTQLWIPTLSDGEYNGAVLFDKYDAKPYSVVDKFLLSEAVNTISAYITKLNAETANTAKSAFLSNMSHEIRTPMNAILGMTEIVLREDMNENTRKCLNIIKSSSKGLLSIINDILDFSKIEAGKIDVVEDNYATLSLLNDVIMMTDARNSEKQLQINYSIPEYLPSVLKGDIVRIRQVIINLTGNAVKYTERGHIDITFGYIPIDDTHCELTFEVKDTGIGIRKEDMPKLFKSYIRLDKNKNHYKEGTGLGLAICRQLVDLMGGSLNVESQYGVGSTFSFKIPQEIIDSAAAGELKSFSYESADESDEPGYTAPDARILLVDDNIINVEVEKAILEPLLINVDEAYDGAEALNLIYQNTYDLILMDHFMPVMDGEECTRRIRQLDGNPNQTIPIIAITADAVSGVKEVLISSGMNDYLTKPIDIKMTYQKIRQWLPADKIKIDNA